MSSCPEAFPFPWWGCFSKHHQGKPTFLLSSWINGFQAKTGYCVKQKFSEDGGKCLLKRVCPGQWEAETAPVGSGCPSWALVLQGASWWCCSSILAFLELWDALGRERFLNSSVKGVLLFLSHCFHIAWNNGGADARELRSERFTASIYWPFLLGFLWDQIEAGDKSQQELLGAQRRRWWDLKNRN